MTCLLYGKFSFKSSFSRSTRIMSIPLIRSSALSFIFCMSLILHRFLNILILVCSSVGSFVPSLHKGHLFNIFEHRVQTTWEHLRTLHSLSVISIRHTGHCLCSPRLLNASLLKLSCIK